jgi:hypothetical protein
MFQGNHHNYLPPFINFGALYEGQPSMMVSWAHSKKILAKLVKETQMFHYAHIKNSGNLQVKS